MYWPIVDYHILDQALALLKTTDIPIWPIFPYEEANDFDNMIVGIIIKTNVMLFLLILEDLIAAFIFVIFSFRRCSLSFHRPVSLGAFIRFLRSTSSRVSSRTSEMREGGKSNLAKVASSVYRQACGAISNF